MRCKDHILLKDKLPYIRWHERAAASTRRGIKQTRCSECDLWFFPWEREMQTKDGKYRVFRRDAPSRNGPTKLWLNYPKALWLQPEAFQWGHKDKASVYSYAEAMIALWNFRLIGLDVGFSRVSGPKKITALEERKAILEYLRGWVRDDEDTRNTLSVFRDIEKGKHWRKTQ